MIGDCRLDFDPQTLLKDTVNPKIGSIELWRKNRIPQKFKIDAKKIPTNLSLPLHCGLRLWTFQILKSKKKSVNSLLFSFAYFTVCRNTPAFFNTQHTYCALVPNEASRALNDYKRKSLKKIIKKNRSIFTYCYPFVFFFFADLNYRKQWTFENCCWGKQSSDISIAHQSHRVRAFSTWLPRLFPSLRQILCCSLPACACTTAGARARRRQSE